MLTQLTIQNFGLIDRLAIEFDGHLNVLTGETGAGKSILIDALRSVLGERIDTSSIRNPKDPCFIEAVFHLPGTLWHDSDLFKDYFSDGHDSLIIQRSHTTDGKSKIKINGFTVTVGQLKAVGDHLIDFHGPHDHQMLLSENNHLGLLDKLADFKSSKKEYIALYAQYEDIQKKLCALSEMAQTRQRDIDLLTHQVKELENVELSQEKYDGLLQEQVKLNNAEKLHEHIQNLLSILDDEENSVNALLRKAFAPLRNLNQIDTASSAWTNDASNIQEQVNDLTSKLNDYAEGLDFDPQTAKNINDSCDTYSDIRRKYGPSLEEAQKFYTETKEKLTLITNFEHNDQNLRQKLGAVEKELSKAAQKITKTRHGAAIKLKETIEKELKELGINHVRFEARLAPADFNAKGKDSVSFFISPNAGEDLKPLAQIVSSGEAARVMLALKKALVHADPVPVLIFDEIDAQIGGRLGTITGKKLKELSESRQVILITHLPQIASFADRHLKVNKSVKSGRAVTDVSLLENKTKVEEIAQMMSGSNTTRIALSHAEDMLSSAQKA